MSRRRYPDTDWKRKQYFDRGRAFDGGALATHKNRVAMAIDYGNLKRACSAQADEKERQFNDLFQQDNILREQRRKKLQETEAAQEAQLDKLLSNEVPEIEGMRHMLQKQGQGREENERKFDANMQAYRVEEAERTRNEAYSGCVAKFQAVPMPPLDFGLAMGGTISAVWWLAPLLFHALIGFVAGYVIVFFGSKIAKRYIHWLSN